jgi:hypothetical protein
MRGLNPPLPPISKYLLPASHNSKHVFHPVVLVLNKDELARRKAMIETDAGAMPIDADRHRFLDKRNSLVIISGYTNRHRPQNTVASPTAQRPGKNIWLIH